LSPSIFLDFNLPNAATWFYFSLLLSVTLFFQFLRPLTLRNFDLLTLFLFVPGFLLLQDSADGTGSRLAGYVWLLAASGYWFVRCLVDPVATRRPVASPNLTTPGLVWFCLAVLICLTAVAYRRAAEPKDRAGKQPAVIAGMEKGAAAVIEQANAVSAPDDQVQFLASRTLAVVCHVMIAAGLFLIGWKHFADGPTGVAAATLYFLVPYTAIQVDKVHHVWPAALLVWAVYFFRRHATAGCLAGLAAGSTFFPVLLLPVWIQFYRGRGAARFLVAFACATAVGVGLTVLALWMTGDTGGAVWQSAAVADWQPWRTPLSESAWTGVHAWYRLPVFVAYVGFVLVTLTWPPARDVGQFVAVAAAVMIGVQFWFADRGGVYVLWYLPLLILLILRPSTTDLQPGPPEPGRRLFGRSTTGVAGRSGGWVQPEPKQVAA
jgi:hypothetical protein